MLQQYMHKLPIIVDKESKSCYIESVETKPKNKIGIPIPTIGERK
jgi:hypothetical protein